MHPSELPKMNGHYFVHRGSMKYFTVIDFVDLNGKTREIGKPTMFKHGMLEAHVVLKDGGRFDFSHPVESRCEDGVLYVEGGNREPMRFAEKDIAYVEICFSPKEEKTVWGHSKYGDKIVIYRVDADPPGGRVYSLKWQDPFATTRQGSLYCFHHKRSRNFYIPVSIRKPGYRTIYTRLRFDKVYGSEKEARANSKTFRFELMPE